MTSTADATSNRARPEALRFLSPEEVTAVAEHFGTPTFVYDEATMVASFEAASAWPSAFGLDVRYAIKAGANGALLRRFDELGASFDACSTWEAMRAAAAGVDPAKILLTGQELVFDEALLELVTSGMEVDACSVRQLEDIARHLPGHVVTLRVNPGFGSGLVNRLTSGGTSSSFGIWIDQVPAALDRAASLGLTVRRLHTHIGSAHDDSMLVDAAAVLLDLAADVASVELINLGGGYRVTSMADDPVVDHHGWCSKVAGLFSDFAERTGRELVVEVEPGTFLMANAGSIVATVLDVVDTGPEGLGFVKVDTGLTELVRPSYYGATHPLVVVPSSPRGDGTDPSVHDVGEWCVAGHCCIAGDVMTTAPGDVERLAPRLLARPTPGDQLVVERAGAYCSSMAMRNFNSFPDAPEVFRRLDGTFELIRRRQCFEDLVANEVLSADLARTASAH